jgi:hypothetical protein
VPSWRKPGALWAIRVQRARLDHVHKVAHDLVCRFDTIYVEKLKIRGMVKNHPLAQAISDVGWGLFSPLDRQSSNCYNGDGNRKELPHYENYRMFGVRRDRTQQTPSLGADKR